MHSFQTAHSARSTYKYKSTHKSILPYRETLSVYWFHEVGCHTLCWSFYRSFAVRSPTKQNTKKSNAWNVKRDTNSELMPPTFLEPYYTSIVSLQHLLSRFHFSIFFSNYNNNNRQVKTCLATLTTFYCSSSLLLLLLVLLLTHEGGLFYSDSWCVFGFIWRLLRIMVVTIESS